MKKLMIVVLMTTMMMSFSGPLFANSDKFTDEEVIMIANEMKRLEDDNEILRKIIENLESQIARYKQEDTEVKTILTELAADINEKDGKLKKLEKSNEKKDTALIVLGIISIFGFSR